MQKRWLPLVLLLWAAGLRFVGLTSVSPPGLSHDEVANWLIDRSILAGHHALYFTEAYGHEAGFHYWQTLLVWLVGDHPLALRLAAAFAGVMGVAAAYVIGRRLFNRPVALLSMAIAAAHFWPVFYSRQALRAISLPLTAGLALYFLWRYLFPKASHAESQPEAPLQPSKPARLTSVVGSLSSLLLASLFLALSSYTYMASRALPFLLAGWLGYLALFHRQTVHLKTKWPAWLALILIYAALSWPLVAFIQAAPEAEARIAEVDGPLRALLAGDVRPAAGNAWAIVKMFGVAGDPLWRQNVAGQPVFGWPLAALFYLGVGLAIWCWRDPRFGLLLIWAAAAALPSLLTVDAPSSIRIILLLPILGLFPAVVIHRLSTLSTVFPQLSTVFTQNLGIVLLTFIVLLFSTGRTVRDIGRIWPTNDEVAFVWQRDLTTMARWLDDRPEVREATIIGWTPETMDEPTMQVTLRQSPPHLRFAGRVGAVTTAVIPQSSASVLLRPAVLPFEPALERALARHGLAAADEDSLVVYRWEKQFAPQPLVRQEAVFGGQLRLMGVDFEEPCLGGKDASCQVISYWQVEKETADERRFFLHMVNGHGEIIGQSDALDAPARFWRPGDWLVQVHTLPVVNEPFALQLGVYDPRPPLARLKTANGEEAVGLTIPERGVIPETSSFRDNPPFRDTAILLLAP